MLTFRWIRHDDWKLIVPTKADQASELLYRVTDDPHEKHDLSKRFEPARVRELTKLVNQRWEANVSGPSLNR